MNKLFRKIALVSAIAGFAAGSVNAASYSSRIVGGGAAMVDTYPWMVSVQTKSDGEHFCGGSLIADSYVLTAAHCLEDTPVSDIQVVISEFDLEKTSSTEETLFAKSVYIHEAYGDDNDIALIELSSASNKTPVQLADTSFNDAISVGANLTVMGWGNQVSEGESFPTILQEVQVPLADHAQCKANYAKVEMDITDNMICAGLAEGGKDSCQGDSGGPLVYQKDSAWYQTGVVSFGEGCAEKDYFGVYTKVSNYGDWIAQVKSGEVSPFQPSEDSSEDADEYGQYPDNDDDHSEGDYYDEYPYDEDEWEHGEFEYEELAFDLPDFVDFVALEIGETVSDSLTLLNTNDTDLSIQGVSIDNDQHFSIVSNTCGSATLKPEESCQIGLEFKSSDEAFHEAILAISTSDTDHELLEIDLFGAVLQSLELDEDFDGMDGFEDEQWFIEGDEAWVGSEDGAFNLSVDTVAVDSEAMLMTELEGPGVLSFHMDLQGDAASNSLTFLVDGEAVKTLSSKRSDKSHTVELSDGEHQVAWIYSKKETSPAAATATISQIDFESKYEGMADDAGVEQETQVDSNTNADNEEVKEAVQTLTDAVANGGSSDTFLLTLLALFGLVYRLRK